MDSIGITNELLAANDISLIESVPSNVIITKLSVYEIFYAVSRDLSKLLQCFEVLLGGGYTYGFTSARRSEAK